MLSTERSKGEVYDSEKRKEKANPYVAKASNPHCRIKIMKKLSKKMMAVTMAATMMATAGSMCVMAADTQDQKPTKVKYEVTEGYEWSIHSEIDFGKDKGVNKTVNNGDESQKNTVTVLKNIIPDGKKLQIIVTGSGDKNAFTIANGNTKLNYTISANKSNIATGGTVLEVPAGTNEGSKDLTFTLTTGDGTSEVAGNYEGTVTYTAFIVD